MHDGVHAARSNTTLGILLVHTYKSNAEFYQHLDALTASLNESGFSEAGQKIAFLIHKVAWTTSSELFGELRILFREILQQHGDSLPRHISDDLTDCIQVIDGAWKT